MKQFIIRTTITFLVFTPIMLVSTIVVAAAEEGDTSISQTSLNISAAVYSVFTFPLGFLKDYLGIHFTSWPEFLAYLAIGVLLWAIFCNLVAEMVFNLMNSRKSVSRL